MGTHNIKRLVQLWHRRLGHASVRSLIELPTVTEGASELQRASIKDVKAIHHDCHTCPKVQMKAKPHKTRETRGYQLTLPSTAFGHLIFTDNAGPFAPSMQWRFVMLTIFVDDHSDLMSVYFSRKKGLNDAIPIRKRFAADHARF